MSTLLVFCTFWGLVALTFYVHGHGFLRERRLSDWIVEGTGLVVQGALVPALQILLAYGVLSVAVPSWRGSVSVPAPLSFALNFVVVDYLYYWNHRLLHLRPLWPIHMVHHSANRLDVLATGRNTLWTPLFILYVWVNSLGMYLLADPAPFLFSAALTAALDLWRHSGFGPSAEGRTHRLLARFLITPHAHAWHHAQEPVHANFGANFSLWDRLHGTYQAAERSPSALGVRLKGGALRHWLRPKLEEPS